MAALAKDQSKAMIDGAVTPLADARLSLLDAGFSRGDGGFETVGVWDGRPFRLQDHLRRLATSLEALALPAAPHDVLVGEAAALLFDVREDAALRIYVTGSGTRILTVSSLPDRGPLTRLSPQAAPWIQPLASYRPAGAKSMSYAPNMTATRLAQLDGADDALLVSVDDRWVLEGPTFGVVFVARGVVHAPDAALGIVDSISRRTVIEIATEHGFNVLTGRWPLAALADAQEVIISSSLRPAQAVSRVGEWTYDRHPVTDVLNDGLSRRRRAPESSSI